MLRVTAGGGCVRKFSSSVGNSGTSVLIAKSVDPFLNIATEHRLFDAGVPGTPANLPSLFLWRNDKVVIFGKHQNPWKEINVAEVKKAGISIVRRFSGGGTVYQDLGNLCYTFLLPRTLFDRERNAGVVVNALSACGVAGAEQRGRNDIVVAGGSADGSTVKVSGAAYRIRGERAIHHGTMLVDADLNALGSLLTPSAKKLASKGIDSVRSRVGNLVDVRPGITVSDVEAALVASFEAEYGPISVTREMSVEEAEADPLVIEQAEKLKEWTWMYGETPDFEHHVEGRLPWATFDIHLDVARGGSIRKAVVFSDALAPDFVDATMVALEGTAYTPEAVSQALRGVDHAAAGVTPEQVCEFANWLAGQIE